jgi:signal transduction histidine kinase
MRLQLSSGPLDEALLKDLAEKIVSDNLRAGSIIQSLRSIFNEDNPTANLIDLGDIVQSVLQITAPELSSRHINVKLHLSAPTIAHVNAPEIQQVILNILNNAIQALSTSPQTHKEITIETSRQAENVFFTIADNGPGISQERQSQLFELTASGKRSGMGLGLWLCKQIVTRNGGTIMHQDIPTGGTRFLIQLPAGNPSN